MIRKIISFILTFVVVVTLLPLHALSVSADTTISGTTGSCTWTLDKTTGTLTISGSGAMANYSEDAIQPWKEREYTDSGYTENAVIKVVIGKNVTSIGSYAFYESGVKSIVFEESDNSRLQFIGDYAFSRCAGLTSVEFPDSGSLKAIGDYAFSGCGYLKYVWFPKKDSDSNYFRTIGEGAFLGCSALTSVNIYNENFNSIGERAFSSCTNLTSVTIGEGKGTVSVGENAFLGCKKLKNFYCKVSSVGISAFSGCSSLTSIDFSSVTSIASFAFQFCSTLNSIVLPATLTSLSPNSFIGCINLTSIIVEEGNTTYHSAGNCLISTKKKQLYFGCKNSVIPDDGSVESIAEKAFGGCSTLTSIVIPDSVASIDDFAFASCGNLTTVTVLTRDVEFGRDIFDRSHAILTLYGYRGSTTEAYAAENGHKFVALDEPVEPEYLPGDINNDGFVEIADAIALFQNSMLPDMYPIDYPGNVDFNSDGCLDIADAIVLFMHSMLPDIYPIS